jgi:hypothetical protein
MNETKEVTLNDVPNHEEIEKWIDQQAMKHCDYAIAYALLQCAKAIRGITGNGGANIRANRTSSLRIGDLVCADYRGVRDEGVIFAMSKNSARVRFMKAGDSWIFLNKLTKC